MFLLFGMSGAEQCLRYTCSKDVNSTCMTTTNSTVSVSPCPHDYYCPPVTGFDTVICQPKDSLVLLSWPGEPCTTNQTCITGRCEDDECAGNKAGESCNDHSDCAAMLYCTEDSICAEQLSERDDGCRDDFDCKNYLGCQFGECVRYMSKYEGEKVSDCTKNRSLVCQSTLCGSGYCLKAVANDKPTPALCTSNEDCVSTWYSTGTHSYPIYTDCQCAMDATGKGVCGLFPGDSQYAYFLEAMEHFVQYEHNWACHTLRRFSLYCMKTYKYHKQYSDLPLQSIYVEHYPELVYSEDCVQEVYFPAYWSCAVTLAFSLSLV